MKIVTPVVMKGNIMKVTLRSNLEVGLKELREKREETLNFLRNS